MAYGDDEKLHSGFYRGENAQVRVTNPEYYQYGITPEVQGGMLPEVTTKAPAVDVKYAGTTIPKEVVRNPERFRQNKQQLDYQREKMAEAGMYFGEAALKYNPWFIVPDVVGHYVNEASKKVIDGGINNTLGGWGALLNPGYFASPQALGVVSRNGIMQAVKNAPRTVANIPRNIKNTAIATKDGIVNGASAIGNGIQKGAAYVGQGVQNLGEGIKNGAQNIQQGAVNLINSGVDAVKKSKTVRGLRKDLRRVRESMRTGESTVERLVREVDDYADANVAKLDPNIDPVQHAKDSKLASDLVLKNGDALKHENVYKYPNTSGNVDSSFTGKHVYTLPDGTSTEINLETPLQRIDERYDSQNLNSLIRDAAIQRKALFTKEAGILFKNTENPELQRVTSKYLQDLRSELSQSNPDLVYGDAGSTLLASKGTMAKMPGDSEFIVAESQVPEMQKALGGNWQAERQSVTGARVINGKSPRIANGGNVELEVVGEDANGMAKGKLAHEMFKVMFPEQYRAMQQVRVAQYEKLVAQYGTNHPIVRQFVADEFPALDMTAKDLIKLYNKNGNDELVQMANYASSSKGKHEFGYRTMMANPKQSAKIAESSRRQGSSFVNGYEDVATTYPSMRFDDVESNKQLLRSLGMSEELASDPEAMRAIAEQLHFDTINSRAINLGGLPSPTPENIKNASTTNVGRYTASGAGGNTTTGPIGGNHPIDAIYTGNLNAQYGEHITHMQTPFKSEVKTPLDLYNQIKGTMRAESNEKTQKAIQILKDEGIIVNGKTNADVDRALKNIQDLGERSRITQKIAEEADFPFSTGNEYHIGSNLYIGQYNKHPKKIGNIISSRGLEEEKRMPFMFSNKWGSQTVEESKVRMDNIWDTLDKLRQGLPIDSEEAKALSRVLKLVDNRKSRYKLVESLEANLQNGRKRLQQGDTSGFNSYAIMMKADARYRKLRNILELKPLQDAARKTAQVSKNVATNVGNAVKNSAAAGAVGAGARAMARGVSKYGSPVGLGALGLGTAGLGYGMYDITQHPERDKKQSSKKIDREVEYSSEEKKKREEVNKRIMERRVFLENLKNKKDSISLY